MKFNNRWMATYRWPCL